MRSALVAGSRIEIVIGDITTQDVDAIVNAANSSLLGGGGVDGAIHRAGGPQILEECRAIVARQGGCEQGEAVATTGGRLRARFVVHTVGPVWQGGGRGEGAVLAHCWTRSLEVAQARGCRTVAFPAISTGAYGYPMDAAAKESLRALGEFLRGRPGQVELVRVVLVAERDAGVWSAHMGQVLAEAATE
jgi:O-acetyl-ADP-ribose deacetylase (regulator of RNase III)